MQINFQISQDLLRLNIPSSSWYFCVYFWLAQTFFLHISPVLWLREYGVFDFAFDHTIEEFSSFKIKRQGLIV